MRELQGNWGVRFPVAHVFIPLLCALREGPSALWWVVRSWWWLCVKSVQTMFLRRGGLAVGRGRRGSVDLAPLMWAMWAGKEEARENSRFPPSFKALPLNYSEICGFCAIWKLKLTSTSFWRMVRSGREQNTDCGVSLQHSNTWFYLTVLFFSKMGTKSAESRHFRSQMFSSDV